MTQKLLTLGHEKKDKPQPLTPAKSVRNTPTPVVHEPVQSVEASPKKVPSDDEKLLSMKPTWRCINAPAGRALSIVSHAVKNELQKLFPDEEEPVLELAMESADYELEKARLLLSNSQEREDSYAPSKHVTFRYKVPPA